jgi:hypothetical protein
VLGVDCDRQIRLARVVKLNSYEIEIRIYIFMNNIHIEDVINDEQ